MKKIFIIIILIMFSFHITYAQPINSDVELKMKIAENYVKNGNYIQAISIYEKMLKEENASHLVLPQLLDAYIRANEFVKALQILNIFAKASNYDEKIVGFYIEDDEITSTVQENFKKGEVTQWKDVDIIIEYAKSLYKAGDYYYDYDQDTYSIVVLYSYLSAYVILDEALKIAPKNSEIYFYQGRLLMDINGDFVKSEEKLKQAIRLNKENFEYFYRLGNAYMHQEKNKEAKTAFLLGIQLNKDYEKLYLNLGNVYFDLGEKKKGFESYNKGLKICWEMCDSFYNNKGNEYFYMNDIKNAKFFYQKALEINPNHENAKNKLGQLKNNTKK